MRQQRAGNGYERRSPRAATAVMVTRRRAPSPIVAVAAPDLVWNGRQQAPRVGVQGRVEQLLHRGQFHDLAQVQHRDPIAQPAHPGQVVANKQDRHVLVTTQIAQQIYDLGLDGNVQRADWLVADQQLRIQHHRACDADALALAAAELMRITVDVVGTQPDARQHGGNRGAATGAIHFRPVHPQRFRDRFSHGHAWIETRERVLENDLQVAAQRPQFALTQVLDGPAEPHDGTGSRPDQLQHRARQRRFSATGFADQSEGLAGPHHQANIVNGP